jgi:plasmid stability protein
MTGVATLHVRNVPPEVYEALRSRAARNGRSINAEVIEILRSHARTRSLEEVRESIRARRERLAAHSDQLPDLLDVIRHDRDSDHGRLG